MKAWSIAVAAVAIAMGGLTPALAQNKEITLCWAALDPANARVELSKDFTARSGVKMKFEFVPWTNFADRMLNELNSRGKLCDLMIGSPSMNFLSARGNLAPSARAIRVNGATVAMPEARESLDAPTAVLGARPEHISIAEDGPLRGRVFAVEYMGARQLITVDTDAGRVRVRAPNTVKVADGETVGLAFDPERLVVFDAETGRALKSAPFDGGAHG